MNFGKGIIASALLALSCWTSSQALAATVYWDPTATLSGSGSGSGTWDTNTTSAWWLSGATSNNTWTDVTGTDTAVFGGPAGGTVSVSGNNVANGLTFNTAGYTLSGGTITLAGATPTITANAADTISSPIAGSAGLTISGNGSLLLSGVNIYTGGTTINSGVVVQAGTSTALGTYTSAQTTSYNNVTVQNGATLDINGQQNFILSLTIAGTGTTGQGALINNGAGQSLGNQDTPNIQLSADATIGGTGNFDMIYASHAADTLNLAGHTLTKTGTNTFSLDNTTVTAGTVNIYQGTFTQYTASNGSAAAFVIAPGATLALYDANFPAGSLAGTGGTVSLGAYALTFGNLGYSTTFAGTITGAGGSLTKLGSGALYLSGNNSYTGGTTISAGTVQMDNAAALGTGTGPLAVNGLLDLNGNSLGVGNFSGSGAVDNVGAGGAVALSVGNGGSAIATYSGNLKNTSGTLSLAMNGTGMLYLTGTNTYSGTTTINGGALVFAKSSALPTTAAANSITIAGGALGVESPFTVNGWFSSGLIAPNPTSGAIALVGTNSETINLTSGNGANYANLGLAAAGNATYSGVFTPSGTNYSLGSVAGGVLTYASSIGGGNSLSLVGASTLILTSTANAYTGGTTISNGTLQVGDGAAGAGSLPGPVVNNSLLQFATPSALTCTATGSISGNGGLLKTGAGTLVLSNSGNSYSGGTVIGNGSVGGGTLTLGANNALPAGSNLTIDKRSSVNSTLNLGAYNQTIGNITFYAGGSISNVIVSSGGVLALTGTGMTLVDAHAGGQDWRLTITAPIDLNGATRTFAIGYGANNDSGDLGDLDLNGSITTSSGVAGLTLSGNGGYYGSLEFGAANTYNGATTLSGTNTNGTTTLGLNANNAFPNNSALVQNASTIVDLTAWGKTNGISTGMGSMSGAGTITLGSAGVLTVGYDGTSTRYAGQIGGAGGQLVKTGAGVLTLDGSVANTYTGGTTLGGGTLALGFNVTGSTTSNILATTGPLTFAGGTLVLQGASSASNTQTLGNITVNAGASSIVLSPGTTNPLTLTTGSTWSQGAGGTVNLSLGGGTLAVGALTGTNGIIGGYATINGSDWAAVSSSAVTAYAGYQTTLPASGNNTAYNYSIANSNSNMTGSLQVNTLKLTTTQASTFTIPTGYALTLSGNGLLFTGSNAYTISGGSITAGNGSGNYDLIVQQFGSAALTMSSAVTNNGSNAVNLVKAGSGTLVLANTNSYTGTTYLDGGVLQFSGTSQLGAATTPITFGGGTLQYNGNTDDISAKTVTINGGGATINTNGQNVTFANAIGNNGPGGLTKAGGGTLTLSASNPFYGPFSVNGGTVSVASIGNNAVASPLGLGNNVNFGGGALQYTGASTSTNRLFTFNSGGGTIGLSAATTLTLTSPTSGAGGLTLAGSGALVLTASPGYTGPTVLSGGTLTAPGNPYYRANNTLNISGSAAVYQSLGTLNLGVNQNGGGASTDVAGSGTLVLAATASSQSAPDIYFGQDQSGSSYYGARMNVTTLNLGSSQRYIDGTSGHNAVGEYYGNNDATINSNIVGGGGISFYATSSYSGQYGELLLGGSNTFSGRVEVDRGAIFLNNASALTQMNAVTLSNSDSTWSNLFLLGYSTTISNLQSAGSTPQDTGIANGEPTMTGPSHVTTPATLTINETANTTFAGTIANAISDVYYGGSYVPGSFSLTKTGAATLTLTGSNSAYSGTTTINQGTLSFGYEASAGSSTLGIIPSSATANDIVLNGGTLSAYNSLNLSANRGIGLGPASGTVGGGGALDIANGQTMAYNGIIASAGNTGTNSFAKTGAGTLVLGGNSTDTGITNVNAGKLVVNGSLSSGTTNVNSGALYVNGSLPSTGAVHVGGSTTLGGSGSVGLATVASGGTIDVSQNSNGLALTLAGLTLGQNAGNSATLNFSGNNFSSPALNVTASNGLTTNGSANSVTINITGAVAANATYPLIAFDGAIGGTGSAAFTLGTVPATTGRQVANLVDTGSQIDWVVSGAYPVWTGANSGLWYGGTNWRLSGSITPTDFLAQDTVVFDDSATGTTAVSITGSVNPLSVTFNNSSLNYSLSGSSGIVGPATVTLNGSATVLISNSNGYTGGTTVNNGLLQVANSAALGTGNLTLTGGALTSSDTTAYTLANPLVLSGNVTLGDPVNNGALTFTAASGTLSSTPILTVNSPVTIAGNLSGDAGVGLTVSGTSVLTLTGSNTYSGTTTISTGTLQVGNFNGAGSLGSGVVTINSAGTLVFAHSETPYTVANNINGSGGLAFNGTGGDYQSAYNLTGTNTGFSGPITLNNARVQAASQTNFGTGPVTITQGSGVLFTGGTFGNTFYVSGTGWDEQVADGYLGAIRLAGATISGPVVLTGNARITAYGSTGTISGTISEVNAGTVLTIGSTAGGGTVTLSGSNTYSGGTVLQSGALAVTNSAALGSGPLVVNVPTGETFLTVATTSPMILPNNITLPSPASSQSYWFYKNSSGQQTGTNVNLTGTISGGNANTILYFCSNTGGDSTTTYTLSGTNTFTVGQIQLYRGGFIVTNTASFGSPTNLVNLNGNSNTTLGDLRFTTSLTLPNPIALSSGTPISPSGYTVTLAGLINGGAQLQEVGSGDLVLTNTNTYTGGTTLSGGTLSVAYLNNSGSASNIGTAGITLDGGTFQYTGGAQSTNRTLTLTANSGAVDGSGSGPLNLTAASISLSGTAAHALTLTGTNTGANTLAASLQNFNPTYPSSLTKTGPGTWVIASNANTYTGGTNVQNGTLAVGGNNTLPTAGTVTFGSATSGGTLDLAGNYQKIGGIGTAVGADPTQQAIINSNTSIPATLEIHSITSNTYGGTIQDNAAGGNGAIQVVLSAGNLALTNTNNSYSGGTSIYGGVLNVAGDGALGTPILGTPSVSINGGALQAGASFALQANRGIALVGSGGTIDTQGNNLTVNGTISGGGQLTVVGYGTLTLAGSNTFTGQTTVSGGAICIANPAALQNSTVGQGSDYGLTFASGITAATLGGLSGGNAYNLTNADGNGVNLSVGNNNTNTTFSGAFSGNGSLTKVGNGALTLTNYYSNHTGGATLDSGTLVLANQSGSAIGNGPLILSGGTLVTAPNGGGINGSLIAGSNPQVIVPGGVGTVASWTIGGSASLNSQTQLDLAVNSAGAGELIINGQLSVAGTANITLTIPSGSTLGSSYTLAQFAAGSAVNASEFNVTDMPFGYMLQANATDLLLTNIPAGPPSFNAGSGSWTAGTNWNGGTVPNGPTQAAVVGGGTSTPVTISLDTAVSLGSLTFTNTTSTTTGYTLVPGVSNTGSLTIANSSAGGTIAVTSGMHDIAAPIYLAENLTVTPSAGTTLQIDGQISEAANGPYSLTLNGPGTLVLTGSNGFMGGTDVIAGTLYLDSNNALYSGTNLTIGDPGAFSAGAVSSGLTSPLAASPSIAPVPEPGTLVLLLALGLWGAVQGRRFFRRRKS